MADNNRRDLTKIDGMGNVITTDDLQSQAIKDAPAAELRYKRIIRDEALAMIDEDERKISELERIVNEGSSNESVGEITVSVNANVDDAVAGFKRLQRELRKTTQELRELERDLAEIADGRPISLDGPSIARSIAEYIEDVEDNAVKLWREKGDLSEVPTYALSEELARRKRLK